MKTKADGGNYFSKANLGVISNEAPGSVWLELPQPLISQIFTQSSR